MTACEFSTTARGKQITGRMLTKGLHLDLKSIIVSRFDISRQARLETEEAERLAAEAEKQKWRPKPKKRRRNNPNHDW